MLAASSAVESFPLNSTSSSNTDTYQRPKAGKGGKSSGSGSGSGKKVPTPKGKATSTVIVTIPGATGAPKPTASSSWNLPWDLPFLEGRAAAETDITSSLPLSSTSITVVASEPTSAPTSTNTTSATIGPDNLLLRLLVPSPPTAQFPALLNRTISLNDKDWYITEQYLTPENAATFPNYTAISYRWYDGRLDNPFYDGYLISNLTLPSLESAMRNAPPEANSAFWIDGFSIPAEKPLKGMVLDLLSNIFSAAYEIVVPLGLQSRNTMSLLAGTEDLKSVSTDVLGAALADLNQDAWAMSIWTYKEALSAKRYLFTDRDLSPSNDTEPTATDLQFFKRVSNALDVYGNALNWTIFDQRLNLPNVDLLEDVGLDRQLNPDPYTRSVVEVLSNLDRRFVESDGNFYWGLYGAITEETIPADTPSSTLAEKYDWLTEVCENKGDYSFIYTSTNRSTTAGKTFYPESPSSGGWHGLLTWPTDSNYQTANVSSDGSTTLNGIVSISPGVTLGSTGSDFIMSWVDSTDMPSNITSIFAGNSTDDTTVAATIHSVLSEYMGFSGSIEDSILTEAGIFYPQRTVSGLNANVTTLLVTSLLGWPFGAPGLAQTIDSASGSATYVPGVFVGNVLKDQAAPVAMS